ncbi:MAG TPA: thioesterase family protein [Pseudonocardiaceae bacterium]|jgi:acyl-CoA thioester hydrolase|nr:thioesterase family protein [Pseudonocardiaceae bacterium]
MDAYGHVNHASTVTLLEEARAEMLFVEASRQDASTIASGMVVARLVVDYHVPLIANGSAVRVEISVRTLKAASFTLDYTVHGGRDAADVVVATAETLMVPYNLESGRPRRLTDPERDFLAGYRAGARSA